MRWPRKQRHIVLLFSACLCAHFFFCLVHSISVQNSSCLWTCQRICKTAATTRLAVESAFQISYLFCALRTISFWCALGSLTKLFQGVAFSLKFNWGDVLYSRFSRLTFGWLNVASCNQSCPERTEYVFQFSQDSSGCNNSIAIS